MQQTIFIASDHRGFALKESLKLKFSQTNWKDLGPVSSAPVDYPDYAKKLCKQITSKDHKGVLICSTGQGMCIQANRFSHIRAALCFNTHLAKLSRQHNDANVLCLSGTLLSFDLCFDIFQNFIETIFDQGRHIQRIEKLSSTII